MATLSKLMAFYLRSSVNKPRPIKPCKAGDSVYIIYKGKYHLKSVSYLIYDYSKVVIKISGIPQDFIWDKNVFGTEEEAKNKLINYMDI